MRYAEGSLRIHILGPVRASLNGTELDLGPPKQRVILALLAIRSGQLVSADGLADALWNSTPPASAVSLVHTYVARLRRALEPDMPRWRRNNVISSTRGGYRLAVPDRHLDLLLFRRRAHQAAALVKAGQPEAAFHLLHQALSGWRDPHLSDLSALLPGHGEIHLLRQELIGVGLEYVTLGLRLGHPEAVQPVAERLSMLEPLNEPIQARSLQVLARTGQRSVAVARYVEVCARLKAELGVDPSPDLASAHHEALMAGVGGEPAVVNAAPERLPSAGHHPAVGELIGREKDLARLLDLLGRYRLVTLTGPVGVGKTALALTLAEAVRDGCPDGVAVVDLSDARGRSEVTEAVYAALRLAAVTSDAVAQSPLGQVADRQSLIILDNAELVVDHAAPVVDDLLRAVPGSAVVVTSRELLGLPYEAVHLVRPLAAGVRAGVDTKQLAQTPAVDLFVRRAAQVNQGFRLTAENAAEVLAICRQLDGLPLAIELAAACLRTVALRTLVGRLRDPLHAIRPARRGGPRHHGSLYAAVHRSIELLSEAERRCFASLAVIDGEFCVEAARVVRRSLPGDDGDVQLLLDRLVDKSLLEVRTDRYGPRYRLLRTLRALAREMSVRAGYPLRSVPPLRCPTGCHCLRTTSTVVHTDPLRVL